MSANTTPPGRLAPAWITDSALALAMAVCTIAGSYGEAVARVDSFGNTVTAGGHPAVRNVHAAAFVLVALAALALAGRRRWPVPVLAISLVCVLVYSVLGYVNGSAILNPMVALYTVATRTSLRPAIAAGTITLASLMAATTSPFSPFGPAGAAFTLIPGEVAFALTLGLAVGSRRAYLRSVEDRAVQAELTREEEARRRVDDERLRIARDLHDVVAHSMSMIHVQAGAALQLLHDKPDETAAALRAIRSASGDGLAELRSILNVLRQTDEAAARQPAPGLAQVTELVAETTRAGLPTTMTVEGEPRTLLATVDLTAYRIIQESLTNSLRHAGPATAEVRLAWSDGNLDLAVTDTGRGAGAALDLNGTGHGIEGMKERAAAVGGTVSAARRAGGGFVVTARLPLSREP